MGGRDQNPDQLELNGASTGWRSSLHRLVALKFLAVLGTGLPLECGELAEQESSALRSWGWELGAMGWGGLTTVHLFCLQTSPLPYTPGVHSEFIISTSSHDVSCFKMGATFIHSSRASCFAPFILLPQCTLSHLSALFHCLSLMLLQQPLFWFPDFGAQTPPGTHPSLVHPSSGSPIHLWFTHPSFSSPIHPLVHTSIHWFTHPSIGPPIHPLVHPSIHWSTHPSIGPPIHHWSTHPSIGSPIHPINIHILCHMLY